MTWREETPQEVQDDLDLLTDEALKAAEHLLERHREFLPFAVSLNADGAVALVGAEPGEDTSSQAMLDLLQRGLLDQRETLRGAALVSMVEGDAVRAEIEHRDGGPSIALFAPYTIKRLRRTVTYGEITAEAGERLIWT